NMDIVSGDLYVLSWILTLMFLKTGLVKVTSRLFPKEHQQTSEEFVLYASVCPTKSFGYTPPPRGYMFVIGFIRLLRSCFVACYRITPLDVFSILCHDDAFNLQS
uniref:Uncharacterized protein n=2 Tax=Magallana gigas TaxID=29159 RepID=A0A8W8J9X1_MAGGI